MIFNKELTNSELAQINSYLANKWSLTTTVDSDNDGFTDAVEIAAGTDPTDDASLAMPIRTFRMQWMPRLGESGLDSLEGNLALWLDAEH